MTDQELYEALGIQHFESGGDVPLEDPEELARRQRAANPVNNFTAEELTAGRVDPNLSQFDKYESPGYYLDPTFNPGGAKDKGFDWGIKADDFYNTFGSNPQNISGDRDPDGKYLTLDSGQKLGVSGRNASMDFTPAHDEVRVNGLTYAEYVDKVTPWDVMTGDRASAPPSMEDWKKTGKMTVQTIPDMFHITTDASGILGREGSGRRLDVTYIKNGDKFVPVNQPEIADYENEAANNWNFAGKAAALAAIAYGAPYVGAEGGVGSSVFSQAPGTLSNAIITNGVNSGLATAGIQGISTGKISAEDVIRNTFAGGVAGGVGQLAGNSKYVTDLPSWMQPGAKTAIATAATGGNSSKIASSFIGANVADAVPGMSRELASNVGIDWDSAPQWVRDAIATGVGSGAAGNSSGTIGKDVAMSMLNNGWKAVKQDVYPHLPSFTGTTPYNYDVNQTLFDPNADSDPDYTGGGDTPNGRVRDTSSRWLAPLTGNAAADPQTPLGNITLTQPSVKNIYANGGDDTGLRGTRITNSSLDNTDYGLYQTPLNLTGVTPNGAGMNGGTGLVVPRSPIIPGMGGQGLTVEVPGGVVGSGGFTPDKHTVVIGDKNSFINNPDLLGQTVIGGIDTSKIGVDTSTKSNTSTSSTTSGGKSSSSSLSPGDLSELAKIMPYDLSMSVEDWIKSLSSKGIPTGGRSKNPIYAAEGGSIDDLAKYLRG